MAEWNGRFPLKRITPYVYKLIPKIGEFGLNREFGLFEIRKIEWPFSFKAYDSVRVQIDTQNRRNSAYSPYLGGIPPISGFKNIGGIRPI